MEIASKDESELQKRVANETRRVNKFTTKPAKTTACFRCGKSSHDQGDCWFRNKNCKSTKPAKRIKELMK